MKKLFFVLWAAWLPVIATAQVNHPPLALNLNNSSTHKALEVSGTLIAPAFDSETVKLLDVIKTTTEQHHVDGLIIKYAI